MTSSGERAYVLGHSEAELKRLETQGDVLAELTEDLLRHAGLDAGMRVLDLGSGAGDVSLLAGRLVGPAGAVVGVDRSPAAVETAQQRADAAGLPWVRFAAGEFDQFSGAGPFDALIGRLVLMYLPDPAATIASLSRALRPGGIVAFQEMRMHTAHGVPDLPLYRQCGEWIVRAFTGAGFETDMGSKLHAVFLRAGLPEPQMIAAARVAAGARSPAYDYLAKTVRSLLPMIERLKVATADDVDIDTLADRLREEAVSSRACLYLPLMVGAWSRTRA